MPQLAELVARQWSEAKSELESSVRSGTHPGSGVDVDAILEKIAGLIQSVGRKELQEVMRSSGSTPRPASRVLGVPAVGNPMVTSDIPGNPMVTSDIDSGGDPMMTSDTAPSNLLGQTGEINAETDPDESAIKIRLGKPAALNKTPTIDQTGDFSTDEKGALLDSKENSEHDTIRDTGGKRKVPVVPGYEISGVLGRGGMGVVYKSSQVGLRRTVALKMILSGEHASGLQLMRFAAEARAVALIHHPGIVQIYEIGEHEGLPYFSLEYCPGGSLDKKLKREPQPPRESAVLVEQLSRAMDAAHTAGVVHRDLKPANVLLDANGIPKITDFGLARELDDTEGNTRTGSILGTPSYMSPEQALGLKEVGPAADQYSLGATLYEVLTGRPPFQGASIMETLEQVRSREPVPPSQLNPACPKDLETICMKALQKESAKRYATCGAMADDLRAYLEGRPISARPVGNFEKAWRWVKRNPRVAGLAGLVALLLLVLGTGGTAAAVVFDQKKKQADELRGTAEEKRIEAEKARDEKDVALKSETTALNEKTIALKASDESYGLTRETVFVALDQIPTALAQALFARAAEQQVIEALGAMLEKQLGLALTRGLPDRAVMNFHLKMGDLMFRQGKVADAEKHFRAGLAITEKLLKTEEKEKDKAKGNHALIYHKLGNLARDSRRDGAADALKMYAEATKLQREVMTNPVSKEIPPAEAKASLASTLFDAADLYRRAALFDRALPPVDEALKLLLEVQKLPPTAYTANIGQTVAETYVLLGRIKDRLGKDDEAEKALQEGFKRHSELLKATPTNVTQQGLTARAARELGDFLLMRNKLDEATAPHLLDLQLTRGLFQIPEIVAAQAELAEVYYRSATLALKKGDRPLSDKLYRKCLELRLAVAENRPNDPRQPIKVANIQARCGMHAEASKTMEDLVAKFGSDPYVVRQAGWNIALCVDAVSAGKPDDKLTNAEKKLRDKYADRSLTLIEDLVNRLKFTDVVQLNTDPDLDPVRNDPRFVALLKKLKATP